MLVEAVPQTRDALFEVTDDALGLDGQLIVDTQPHDQVDDPRILAIRMSCSTLPVNVGSATLTPWSFEPDHFHTVNWLA